MLFSSKQIVLKFRILLLLLVHFSKIREEARRRRFESARRGGEKGRLQGVERQRSRAERINSIDILARFISIAFSFARKSRAENFWVSLEIFKAVKLTAPRVSTFSTMKKLLGLGLNQRPSAQ